jgi:hypothetical protein
MKTLEQWAKEHDVECMSGIGSGCSYNRLVEWSRPAWDYQQSKITELEAGIAEAVQYLREGKAKFAPHTDNSLVDRFIEKWEARDE